MSLFKWPLVALVAPALLAAQDTARVVIKDQLVVRTYTLRHLDQGQAGRLLSPYIYEPNAAAFPGATSHEITIRASRRTQQVVDSVLRDRDKPAATLNLRFELYAAVDSGGDALPQDIGPALRSAFRFKGYRLVSQGSISTSEDESFSTTLGAASIAADAALYRVGGRVESIAGSSTASVPLTIRLVEVKPDGAAGPEVFSTGLTIPVGQTVVLGSGAVGEYVRTNKSGQPDVELHTQALILAVHPEIVPAKPD
jgi:hypothetical protein